MTIRISFDEKYLSLKLDFPSIFVCVGFSAKAPLFAQLLSIQTDLNISQWA